MHGEIHRAHVIGQILRLAILAHLQIGICPEVPKVRDRWMYLARKCLRRLIAGRLLRGDV
jgi:hypothetical protein